MKVTKLPKADAFNYPYGGYSKKTPEFYYKELKADKAGWLRFRKELLKKQDFKCAYCLCCLKDKRMNVEHVLPLRRGGTNEKKNLVASCARCNEQKRNKILGKSEMLMLKHNLKKLTKAKRRSIREYRKKILTEEELEQAESELAHSLDWII